ncbi:MAG TPA: hypothetical protein VMF07_06230 [Solirubrobacteraceae bacterium]|nr:hypothetical protein [Solirubrobacteraceae bacterium]
MSATGQPSEEELRAAYEAEIKQIRVEQILLEQLVTLINLGMRRTGLQPGTEDERDPAQVRVAIEGVRALLPLVEDGVGAEQTAAIRQALSQMQMAYVRIGGSEAAAPAAGGASPAGNTEPGGSAAGGPGEPVPGSSPPGVAGEPGATQPGPEEEPGATPGQPGPAERSGRLWIPGQR